MSIKYGIRIPWDDFKAMVDQGVYFKEIILPGSLRLMALDGDSTFQCIVHTDGDMPTEYAEYQANYEALKNKVINALDSDGRSVSRVATAKKGWSYLEHVIELQTGTKGGHLSLKWDNTDRGLCDMRMYELIEAVETLMVQGGSETDGDYQIRLTADCIRTDIVIRPDYDYEVIGGTVSQIEAPVSDARLWVIAGATDLGAAGIREYIGGKNLVFLGDVNHKADGRTAKFMNLTTEGVPAPTNKIQFIVRHAKGLAHRLEISLEYFRA